MKERAPLHTGDALDWLHEQGKLRSEEVPECDVEETLLMVRIADQLQSPDQDQNGPPGGSLGAFETTRIADRDTREAGIHSLQVQLELALHIEADGEAKVRVRGELCIATADQAYMDLRDIIDNCSGPITMNLAELTFCDAAGLGFLARAAGYARRSGRTLHLTAARPALQRIMRITGMDEAFPDIAVSRMTALEAGHNPDPEATTQVKPA